MELKKHKLGEIAKILNGSTPSTLDPENYDGDIVWATPKDLSDQKSKYFYCGSRNITKKGYANCSTQMIPANNILMSSRAPIGLFAINKVDCCTNQGFKNIILDKTISDVDFMYYFLKYHVKEIEALGSGTTFKEVSKASFEQFEICIPSLSSQRKIASVLSSLDSKIALNRRINTKLETIAKRLYDYWFVQFDFPDANGNPYKSSGGKMVWNDVLKRAIPEGWEVKSIFDACNLVYGFPYATDSFDEENLETSQKPYKVVRIRDIQHNTYSAQTTEKTDDKYRTKRNDLLVGMDGYFHMNFWFRDDDYVNQRIVRLRKTQISTLILYHQMKPFIKFKEEMAKGSTVGHLSDKDLKQLFVVIPNDNSISNRFDSILNLMTERKAETARLTALRDKLLPLLMNGQVEVA